MIAFKKSGNVRDLVFIDGKIQFVNDIDVIIQNCDSAIRQSINELPFNADKGIDFFDNILLGVPNYQLFEAQLRNQLLNVDGVNDVISIDYSITENELSYTVYIDTIYEEVKIYERIYI